MRRYPPTVVSEIRSVTRIALDGGPEFLVCVTIRGASCLEPAGLALASLMTDPLIGAVQRRRARRSSERKVGIFERKSHWWGRGVAIRRYRAWTSTPDEADRLADELCAELERGICRWKGPT